MHANGPIKIQNMLNLSSSTQLSFGHDGNRLIFVENYLVKKKKKYLIVRVFFFLNAADVKHEKNSFLISK